MGNIYDFLQMNSLFCAIIVVSVAVVLILALWWIDWHPHTVQFR